MKAEMMTTVMVITRTRTRMKGTKVTEMVETTMATTTVRKTEITELTVTAMNCSNFGNPGESFRVRRVQCNPARFHLWNSWYISATS